MWLNGPSSFNSKENNSSITEAEGNKNSATLKLPFWDTDFKLFTKKQKIQKEALTLPRFPVQEIQSEKSAMGGRA